jgi:hypothetical protein
MVSPKAISSPMHPMVLIKKQWRKRREPWCLRRPKMILYSMLKENGTKFQFVDGQGMAS